MADPTKKARAKHSYNLLSGLEMTTIERATMLDRVLEKAGMAPLGAIGVEAISRGAVSSLSEIGLEAAVLEGLIDAFYTVDLSAVISESLVEMTGTQPGEPPPMPEPEPEKAAPEPVEPGPAPTWTWDVVLSVFDPVDRAHHLTLLRGGGSVCSTPIPVPHDGFGPLVDRLASTFPDADPVLFEKASQTFETPDCPDLDALLAELREGRNPPDQLYLVQIAHALPNPCLHRQRFQLTEPGDNSRWTGRIQELMTEIGYRPAGLSLQEVRTRTAASWGSPARLQRRGQDIDFRPPLLAPGRITSLPLQCDWQLRAGWSVRCTALHEDGPQVSISAGFTMDGEIVLDGRGHLQEHLAGSVGLAAGVFDENGCTVHTGEAPLPAADWSRAADVGFGALGVVSDSGEHDLLASGTHLSDTIRPSPGIKPRLTWQTALPVSGTLSGGSLSGATVIDATAQLYDALGDAQSIGSTNARAQARATLRLTFDDGHNRLTVHLTDPVARQDTPGETADIGPGLTRSDATSTAPAGSVEVNGMIRYGLDWHAKTTTLTAIWTEALDSISDGDWLGSGESLREPAEGRNTVEVAWVEGGYSVSAVEVGEE